MIALKLPVCFSLIKNLTRINSPIEETVKYNDKWDTSESNILAEMQRTTRFLDFLKFSLVWQQEWTF